MVSVSGHGKVIGVSRLIERVWSHKRPMWGPEAEVGVELELHDDGASEVDRNRARASKHSLRR